MKVLVLGASGATGKLVVKQLIKKQINVRIVVRKNAILSPELQENPLVEIERGNITEYNRSEMARLLQECDAVVSCLGHTITIKGIFGKPHDLVSDTIRNLCRTIMEKRDKKVKIILMSTTAYTNKKTGEKNSPGEAVIFSLLKLLLPPHRDNVNAADCLQDEIGNDNDAIEWIAVRPDGLINNDVESAYEVHASPVRSPLFNAGKVSRINVSRFMADLLDDDELWRKWRFKMPVLYNR
ncbi:MAG: SDR family oxidoreductase [Chitinivibrionales bacterium]|nr:SDR family oxidoreductase [Chitinivibrionales bacterium]